MNCGRAVSPILGKLGKFFFSMMPLARQPRFCSLTILQVCASISEQRWIGTRWLAFAKRLNMTDFYRQCTFANTFQYIRFRRRASGYRWIECHCPFCQFTAATNRVGLKEEDELMFRRCPESRTPHALRGKAWPFFRSPGLLCS